MGSLVWVHAVCMQVEKNLAKISTSGHIYREQFDVGPYCFHVFKIK